MAKDLKQWVTQNKQFVADKLTGLYNVYSAVDVGEDDVEPEVWALVVKCWEIYTALREVLKED